jgi:N-dimethylarginine dimethylaminohydrolase
MSNGRERAVRRLKFGGTIMSFSTKARFLMCPPDHFGVAYKINPWMDPDSWESRSEALVTASRREWGALRRALSALGVEIDHVPAAPDVPDLVFTANSAVVLDRVALLARFRYPQRRREERHFEAALRALQARGLIYAVEKLPDDIVLEGAGDCVWDDARGMFWMGFGPRSDAAARDVIEDQFGVPAVALELVDPRFYHMDTALCPLTRGEVVYAPGAFTPLGQTIIRDRVEPALRIELAPEDACQFAANTVCFGNTLVMSGCSAHLHAELEERGYRLVMTPLPSFHRSGGSAFCLTLRLDRSSDRGALRQTAVA